MSTVQCLQDSLLVNSTLASSKTVQHLTLASYLVYSTEELPPQLSQERGTARVLTASGLRRRGGWGVWRGGQNCLSANAMLRCNLISDVVLK